MALESRSPRSFGARSQNTVAIGGCLERRLDPGQRNDRERRALAGCPGSRSPAARRPGTTATGPRWSSGTGRRDRGGCCRRKPRATAGPGWGSPRCPDSAVRIREQRVAASAARRAMPATAARRPRDPSPGRRSMRAGLTCWRTRPRCPRARARRLRRRRPLDDVTWRHGAEADPLDPVVGADLRGTRR